MKFEDLPLDILIDNILYDLDTQSLVRLSGTCNTFRRLIDDELLWKHRVLTDYNLPLDASFRHTGWKRLYLKLEDSVVYTWGENMDGRLGHPCEARPVRGRIRGGARVARRDDRFASPQELVSLRGKGIVDIVSSGWGFHALDRHGRVWLWGRMLDGYGGQILGQRPVPEPTQVQVPSKIQAISCGRSHAIALGSDASVWHWNNYQIVQRILIEGDPTIVQVAANWGYSSLITSQGKLVRVDIPPISTNPEESLPDLVIPATSGVTLQSIEANAKNNSVPLKPIEKGDKIVQIAGLEKCTLALTRYGRIFKIWTELADPLMLVPATLTTELTKYGATEPEINDRDATGNNKKMHRFVSSQFRNFAVYTASGSVLLGHQDETTAESEPEVLEQLQHDICKVTFGDYHCGALTNQGRLLTWGANSNGAIGDGTMSMFAERKNIPEEITTLRNMFVFAIGFGGWQSSALAIPRD
ncbi:regulator of chromosome condensation 1/beta-lactamase-inhibitor protein II [Phascolomyces articulosus]|uniref:Regulator of chromosome condensation 1/beta-lactamase-inhibitor protein II n=1 Tax=Phascolomyces articulosus TaxID=60185 RepID=A0AAD5PK03_9FUNG|nr:regulator of chromosome condensation 1/beta-lactamase-inhibitor protein II [Phascolomyces articulosus]